MGDSRILRQLLLLAFSRFVGVAAFALGVFGVWTISTEPVAAPARFLVRLPPAPSQAPITGVLPHDCSLLYLRLESDGTLMLNSERIGGLSDARPLIARLQGIFRQRVENRVIHPDYYDRSDLPLEKRIPNQIVIKAPPSASYGDVARLIDSVTEGGTRNIGLLLDDLD